MSIQALIVHFSQIFKSTGFTNFQFIMTCKMCIADFEGHNCMHIFLIFLNWKIDILSKHAQWVEIFMISNDPTVVDSSS